MRQKRGFSILEILIILGIIGILFTISFMGLATFRASARLQDATQTVVQAINLAQSDARRLSVDQEVSWENNSFEGQPLGEAISLRPASGSFIYYAPYGTLEVPSGGGEEDDDGSIFITLTDRSGKTSEIAVIGVIGKVYSK